MKRLFTVTCMTLVLCMASSANATSQYNTTLNQVGVQGGPSAYFTIEQSLTLNCQFNLVYVDISTVFGRAAYAQLLAAKLTNSPLSRIDYSQSGGSGSSCFLSLVEVQN